MERRVMKALLACVDDGKEHVEDGTDDGDGIGDGDGDFRISDEAPQNDLFIEWVYTIDFDRNAFSVDNGAHFRLDNLPPGDTWIAAIDIDHTGQRCLAPSLAPEYRADMRLPRPEPAQELLDFYHQNAFEPSLKFESGPSDVVFLLDTLSVKSCAQQHSMQMVDQFATEDPRFFVPAMELLSNIACGGCKAVTWHKIRHYGPIDWLGESRFFYLLSTHLDHPRNLNAAVSEAAKFAQSRYGESDQPIKGIIFSILHVVGVEVSFLNGKLCARHTAAIPLFDGNGIVCPDGIYTLRHIISRQRTPLSISKPPRRPSANHLPFEIWHMIFSLIADIRTLQTCTLINSYFYQIAVPLLDAPHLGSFCIKERLEDLYGGNAASFEVYKGEKRFIRVTVPVPAYQSLISDSRRGQLKKLALPGSRLQPTKCMLEYYVFTADAYYSEEVRAILHPIQAEKDEDDM